MQTWVLIVYIGSSGLYVPMTAHRTEEACYRALDEWVFAEPGSRGTCLPGTIQPDERGSKRQKTKQ